MGLLNSIKKRIKRFKDKKVAKLAKIQLESSIQAFLESNDLGVNTKSNKLAGGGGKR